MAAREELSQHGTEVEGITVASADGRLFFLTNEDAERLSIPNNRLYKAFRAMRDNEPHPAEKDLLTRSCIDSWNWLESHSPNSATWRRRCLKYFDECV
jgi:hypothetical protein